MWIFASGRIQRMETGKKSESKKKKIGECKYGLQTAGKMKPLWNAWN